MTAFRTPPASLRYLRPGPNGSSHTPLQAEHVCAVVVVRAIGQVRVDVVVGVRVVERSRKRVVAEQRVASRETLLGLQLHRVVVVARVAAVVAEVLTPAELLEVRLALIGRQRAESFDRGLVEVVIAAEAGEHVRALVADVGGLHRHVAAAADAAPSGSRRRWWAAAASSEE